MLISSEQRNTAFMILNALPSWETEETIQVLLYAAVWLANREGGESGPELIATMKDWLSEMETEVESGELQ